MSPRSRADPLQLVVQQVAGHRVERAERLVHQQHVRVLGQRPGQGDPLPHAAGQLVRPLAGEAAQVHQVQQFGGPVAPLGLRARRSARRASSTFLAAVSQGNSAGSWNMSATRWPPVEILPAVGRVEPGHQDSSVLLPQPDAPIRQTNSPGATSRDSRSRASSVGAPRPEDLGHLADPDRRPPCRAAVATRLRNGLTPPEPAPGARRRSGGQHS